MTSLRALLLGPALLAPLCLAPGVAVEAATAPGPYQRVLLISIDGMHAVDLISWFHYAHFGVGTDPLRSLSLTGTVFMNAYTSAPSDGLPGMLAQITGGTPKSTGVYDATGYDRSYFPPRSDCTGKAGAPAVYDQSIDLDPSRLDGGGTLGQPLSQIAQTKLPKQLAMRAGKLVCTTVLPHMLLHSRTTDTVFEQIHAQLPGSRTAWADEHPAYEVLNGPTGHGVDDMFTPEINATANPSTGIDYTQSFADVQTYDHMKTLAVINEIRGLDSSGTTHVGVPTLFGLSFQSVSVGQTLAVSDKQDDPPGLVGGYKSAAPNGGQNGKCKLPGFWNSALASLQKTCPGFTREGQINFVDNEIGAMVKALTNQKLLDSTLIIISAKHGQAPIDPKLVRRVDPAVYAPYVPSSATAAYSDVGLIWLDASSQATSYKTVEKALSGHLVAMHLQQVLSGTDLSSNYNSPFNDDRVPDFITLPLPGVIYTTGKNIADHGGFSDDDRNVALMVSAPDLPAVTNGFPIETRQVAPFILKALGLDYTKLKSFQQEGTEPLPIALPAP